MQQDIRAPIPEQIHYLAIFRRAFVAIEAFGDHEDVLGMLMAGHLADALHNVPSMLWAYEVDGMHSPASIASWLKMFPAQLRTMGAPARAVEECRRILSGADDARDLGLASDPFLRRRFKFRI